MLPSTYGEVILAQRPATYVTEETFKHESKAFDLKPGPKEALVRVDYLSLDAGMRGWLNDTPGDMPPVQIGATMRAFGMGKILEVGPESTLAVGDYVLGITGATEYAVMKEPELTKLVLPPAAEPVDFLGALGTNGLTAYFGLLDVGKTKAGETLVVSGAAGATGSIVCQIGKIIGCKVIGITGSDEKCSWLESDLGVDKALNYKSPTFKEDLKAAAGFIDVYYDNVGGEILDVCLELAALKARFIVCGAISIYNEDKTNGIRNYMMFLKRRITMQGFVFFDYAEKFAEAREQLSTWIAEGKIQRRFSIVEGLPKFYEGMHMLYTGGNIGKVVVKVRDGI